MHFFYFGIISKVNSFSDSGLTENWFYIVWVFDS